MAKLSRILALLAIVGMLSALPAAALAQSDQPHIFIGKATVNGIPATPGSVVTAWDGDKQIGTKVVAAGGTFVMLVSRADGAITFKVDGVDANESHPTWQSGDRTGTSAAPFALTVQGQTAAPGAQGPPGPAGAQGEKGDKGDKGDPGADGADGSDGADGAQGEPGIRGPEGPQGPQGDAGIRGPEGPQGPQGEPGNDGAPGAAGNDGAPGQAGATGPAGQPGVNASGTTGIIAIIIAVVAVIIAIALPMTMRR